MARALAMGPALVLADEPTGNLDTKSADVVFALLRRFNRDHGMTLQFVTHNPGPGIPLRQDHPRHRRDCQRLEQGGGGFRCPVI